MLDTGVEPALDDSGAAVGGGSIGWVGDDGGWVGDDGETWPSPDPLVWLERPRIHQALNGTAAAALDTSNLRLV